MNEVFTNRPRSDFAQMSVICDLRIFTWVASVICARRRRAL